MTSEGDRPESPPEHGTLVRMRDATMAVAAPQLFVLTKDVVPHGSPRHRSAVGGVAVWLMRHSIMTRLQQRSVPMGLLSEFAQND